MEDDDSEEDSEDVTGAGVELSCVRSELGAVRMGEGAKALAPTTRRERMAVVLMVGYAFMTLGCSGCGWNVESGMAAVKSLQTICGGDLPLFFLACVRHLISL